MTLVKTHIVEDEWYPVFSISDDGAGLATPIELTDEELADYHRVMTEFNAWQKRLSVASGRRWGQHPGG